MKIEAIECWRELVPLTRPYTIALTTTAEVELFFIKLIAAGGMLGLGSAAPFALVTGESPADCAEALTEERLGPLVAADLDKYGELLLWAEEALSDTPAARAAVDMAILDLASRARGVALVDLWGRCHDALPTSITIGIKSTAEAIEEAREYLGRGFRCLKVKLGLDAEEDLERLHRLREAIGPNPRIRVDANQGYDLEQVRVLAVQLKDLDIEFLEQPLVAGAVEALRDLPLDLLEQLAFDESLQGVADAERLIDEPVPTWVIKLMKCGGPSSAKTMADLAAKAGKQIMWGCMDESRISIAAAMHTAYASPATRYLDLDGAFDLAADPAEGGFVLEAGCMRLLDDAGLGVSLRRQ